VRVVPGSEFPIAPATHIPVLSRKFRILPPEPETLNPGPETLNSEPETLDPEPQTTNHKPCTLNPKPDTSPARQLRENIEAFNKKCTPEMTVAVRAPAPQSPNPKHLTLALDVKGVFGCILPLTRAGNSPIASTPKVVSHEA